MLPGLQVKELELGTDMKSVVNLLDFLEKVFNGGSDFNEPIRRCLTRLSDAKWANSDILLVSDGELRQPGQVGAAHSRAALSNLSGSLGPRHRCLLLGALMVQSSTASMMHQLRVFFWASEPLHQLAGAQPLCQGDAVVAGNLKHAWLPGDHAAADAA